MTKLNPKTDDSIQEFFQKTFDDILKELHYEIGRLKKWFNDDFPEARLDCLVDINNIVRTLTITTRVLMGEEVVKNRGYFENRLVLPEKRLIDPGFMRAFFEHFSDEYRREISTAVNKHYQTEKQKENRFDVA